MALSDTPKEEDPEYTSAIKSEGENSLSVPEEMKGCKRQKIRKGKNLVRELKKYLRG